MLGKIKDKIPKAKGNQKKSGGNNERKGLPKRNNKKKTDTWKIVLMIIGACIVVGLLAIFVLYQVNRVDISDYQYAAKEKTQIISADDQVIAELFTQNRTNISLDQVPKHAINAIVATEDSRFYSHGGVDYIGIVRSLIGNILGGNATGQGASTITQQLSRLLFLPDISTESSFFESFNRKFKEISIARQLEDRYTKDQILEMFFNETYFGSGAYGIEEAAKTYFGKNAAQCNLAECAMLAGLPQAPSAYAPNSDFEAAKERQNEVLNRMVAMEYISDEEAKKAYETQIVIVPWVPEKLDHQVKAGYGSFVNRVMNEYAKFQAPTIMKERNLSEDEAIDYIRTQIGSGGYKIYTTIDTRFQDAALGVVNGQMEGWGSDYTGALVTVALDGAVKAYYGGKTDIDMADCPRQPGSGIKPLYYSCAFEKGIATPETTVVDELTDFGGWVPQNSHGTFSGTVTYRYALVQSLNIPSAKLYRDIGSENALPWLKDLGITTIDDEMDANLAASLGGLTNGIKPCEMAAAYNTFNNSGIYNQPYFIVELQKSNGEKIYERAKASLDTHQCMSAETAATMWNVLEGVVTSGTGTGASCGVRTAGKTGTTDSEYDLWFNGMTANYTTSIWCGSPSNQRIGSGSYMTAGMYGSYMRSLVYNGVVTDGE